MYMDVDTKITSIYENVHYLGMYGMDVFYTFVLFAFTLFVVSMQSYYAIVNEIKNSWSTNRCIPIIMPFAGIIMPKAGQSSAQTTFENFNFCVYQDISSALEVVMMPFQFVLQLTMQFLELTLDSIMKTMALLAWLKKQFGGIMEKIYNQVIKFIIPIIEMTVYLRDMMGKINAVITTGLFTIMTIYNITVSGLINILTILVNILIAILVIVVATMILIFALSTNPFTLGIGLAMQIVLMIFLVGVIIPALIICALLNTEIKDSFNESSPSPPSLP